MKYTPLLAAGLWLISSGTEAKTVTIKCPGMIETKQNIVSTPAGFQAIIMNEPTLYWETITFYNGNPNKQASLVPNIQTETKAIWKFTAKDEIYMSCGYYRTNIEIFKMLPKTIESCTVIYDQHVHGATGPVPKSIQCEMKINDL
jgi:hypothetical protein